MGFLHFFKDWKALDKKIYRSFYKFRKELDLKISREDVKELIKKELHEQLHAVAAPITARAAINRTEKRILKKLDSIKLMKAIKGSLDDGYSTSQVRDEIMNRFDIKERCFYKYLKKVKEEISPEIRA
ncbi:unnamed protein product [marine sediment metagenome]|uniref:Uncharacterized protein n=1 Tax=marine sediment metagenome TaxID=412755 RepID=X1MUK2_9ZZZZ